MVGVDKTALLSYNRKKRTEGNAFKAWEGGFVNDEELIWEELSRGHIVPDEWIDFSSPCM